MSHGGGGGSKKCGKSVTYYLNGPLIRIKTILSNSRIEKGSKIDWQKKLPINNRKVQTNLGQKETNGRTDRQTDTHKDRQTHKPITFLDLLSTKS
jgi:hypothetical protein